MPYKGSNQNERGPRRREASGSVWAMTGDVSGPTILRHGSTLSYIAPSLVWDIFT